MAAPITWRNVEAANLTQAAIPLAYSQQSINSAFDSFNNIIKQREAVAQSNTGVLQEADKQNYLDQLSQAKNPEQLAELQRSGLLDTLRGSLSPQARASVRGADEARLTSLRQQSTAANAFNDSEIDRMERPIIERVAALREAGDLKGARALLEQENLRNESALYASLSAAERTKTMQEREATNFNNGQKTQAISLENAEINLAATKKQTADAALVDRAVGKHLNAFQEVNVGVNTQIAKLAQEAGLPVNQDGLPDAARMTPEQVKAFNGTLSAAGLKEINTSSQALNNLRRDLIASGASPSVIAAAMSQGDVLFKGNTQLNSEDSARLSQLTGVIDMRLESAKNDNLYYTPPKELQSAKTSVLEKVDSKIEDGSMTKTGIRKKISKWMDDGILMKGPDGKNTLIPVPPKVIEAAMAAGLENDTWFWNDTISNMEPVIKRFLLEPQYQGQRDEATWLLNDGHIARKLEIEREFKNNTGTVTPNDWLANFNRAVDKANKK